MPIQSENCHLTQKAKALHEQYLAAAYNPQFGETLDHISSVLNAPTSQAINLASVIKHLMQTLEHKLAQHLPLPAQESLTTAIYNALDYLADKQTKAINTYDDLETLTKETHEHYQATLTEFRNKHSNPVTSVHLHYAIDNAKEALDFLATFNECSKEEKLILSADCLAKIVNKQVPDVVNLR